LKFKLDELSLLLRLALNDHEMHTALKRMYNLAVFTKLAMPASMISTARSMVDKSKILGSRFNEITPDLFSEFTKWKDESLQAQGDWEKKCQSCVFARHDYDDFSINDSFNIDESWCLRYSYESVTCPDACPEYHPATVASGDN
jgi:hypothetical protein